jgi:predicted HTH transcriptional regulator
VKFQFFNTKENQLYLAIIKNEWTTSRALLDEGVIPPQILYLQIPNHDDAKTLSFLLTLQPNENLRMLRLSIVQGGVKCTELLLRDENISLASIKQLAQIKSRRNQQEIAELVSSAIVNRENSASSDHSKPRSL